MTIYLVNFLLYLFISASGCNDGDATFATSKMTMPDFTLNNLYSDKLVTIETMKVRYKYSRYARGSAKTREVLLGLTVLAAWRICARCSWSPVRFSKRNASENAKRALA